MEKTLSTTEASPIECGVFSPCGRYFVKYRDDRMGTVELCVYTKQSHNFATIAAATTQRHHLNPPSPDYRAVLDAVQVEEITTNAGVRKEFDAFSKMIFSALVGSNTSVSFFVENCAEMERRIRERRVGSTLSTAARMKMDERADGTKKEGHHDDRDSSSADEDEGALLDDDEEENDDEASIRRRFFHQQLFFSLDYDVDFTRALFPIPLSHTSSASLKSGRSLTTTLREQQSLPPSSSSAAAKGNSGEDGGYHAKYVEASRDKKKLELEVKRLKKENDALTKLCNERMTEMQRLCDDLQVKIGSEAETRRLKKDLAEAQRRVQQLESLNDSLRREVKAAASGVNSRSSPLRRPSPSRLVGPATQPQSVRQRRFDTPPHKATSSSRAALHGAPRDSSRQSSRASTPPRSPRPAWGQRAPPQPTNRSLHSSYDSLTSDNGPSKPQRRFDSPRKGPMVSPRSAHQRLYMTDTASSSGLRHKYDRDRLLLS